ncbi:MAG TPA: hypothetical protein PLL20_20080 [Phycisphaerae bacterium]|nr:hypothetical protein [Phycisphaerae bacterium]HRR87524.1 hypothetical protein [Phycisphaerae bacterium]
MSLFHMRHARSIIGMALLLSVAGCSPMSAAVSGAKVSMKVFTGAQAKAHPLEGLSPDALQPYRSIALGEVTTDVSPICTFDVLSEVRSALAEAFADEHLRRHFPGGKPRLVVNVVVRFFKQGNLFGKEPRLDLLVSFVDGSDGREVGRVYVEGISESPLETKARHLAAADAKELANLLRSRKK